jgi:U2 small nuclear ribonucleoprotein B''
MIPGRKGIAFVEYTDEGSSSTARDALHNYRIGEDKMKVTFARQ